MQGARGGTIGGQSLGSAHIELDLERVGAQGEVVADENRAIVELSGAGHRVGTAQSHGARACLDEAAVRAAHVTGEGRVGVVATEGQRLAAQTDGRARHASERGDFGVGPADPRDAEVCSAYREVQCGRGRKRTRSAQSEASVADRCRPGVGVGSGEGDRARSEFEHRARTRGHAAVGEIVRTVESQLRARGDRHVLAAERSRGRAIADLQLARADGSSQRFYSMSAQIQKERNNYYNILESTQKGFLDITIWMNWFLACLNRSLDSTDILLTKVLNKAKFRDRFSTLNLNERQIKILNKLLDGFEGKLTSSKWATLTKCSQDTALRDIQNLIAKNVLIKEMAGGRSTSYVLIIHT